MKAKRRKVTLVMEESVVYGIHEAVGAGWAKSQSGLVEEAVVDHLRTLQRKALALAYADAAKDPMFLADLMAVEKDFESADAEIFEQP